MSKEEKFVLKMLNLDDREWAALWTYIDAKQADISCLEAEKLLWEEDKNELRLVKQDLELLEATHRHDHQTITKLENFDVQCRAEIWGLEQKLVEVSKLLECKLADLQEKDAQIAVLQTELQEKDAEIKGLQMGMEEEHERMEGLDMTMTLEIPNGIL